MSFRVLVIEDEAIAADAHAGYVTRTPGFEVAAVARSGRDAMRHLSTDPDVDLILLDMHLPDTHGLALMRHIRGTGLLCDVIAVTSARDVDVVQQAVAQGVVAYLLKPFTYSGFRAKLDQYAAYRAQLAAQSLSSQRSDVGQAEVDAMLALLRPSATQESLPKGLSASSLALVTRTVREAGSGASAREVALVIGASRVTARRYLEHLADAGLVSRVTRYGGTGRPEVEYGWGPR